MPMQVVLKSLILIMAFFCITYTSLGQYQQRIDSLLSILETEKDERKLVNSYVIIGMIYRDYDPRKLTPYVNAGINLARKINDTEGLSELYYLKGVPLEIKGKYDSVLILLDTASYYANLTNYSKGLANVYRGRSHVYEMIGLRELRLENAKKLFAISKELEDFEAQVSSLTGIALHYKEIGNIDTAATLFQQTLALCELHDLNVVKSLVLNLYGGLLSSQGNYERALELHKESLAITLPLNELHENVGSAYKNLGNIYAEMGDYVASMSNYQKAFNIFTKLGLERELPYLFDLMGVTQAYIGNMDQAASYFEDGLKLALDLKLFSQAIYLCNNMGYLKTLTEEYDTSLYYLEKGLLLSEKYGQKGEFSLLYGSFADLYRAKGELDKVVQYYEKSLEIFRELDYKNDITLQLEGLCTYYLELKYYRKSISNANECIAIANEIGVLRPKIGALAVKAKAHAALGEGMKAYEAHVAYKAAADSLFDEDKTKALTRLEADYEFQQEKDSIQFATEKEKLALNATIESGKARQLATLVVLTAVGLILLVLGVFYYKNQKKNQQLTALNKEIQNQNIEIKSQRDHLNDLNKTKSKFFSIISHDLRSPISSFQVLSDIIDFNLKQENYDEIKEINQEVVKRSKEIGSLLDNLLSWAVNEEGQFPFNPTSVSVKAAIDEVVNIYLPVANYKNIVLKNEADEIHHIWADANSFKTIIRNLVSNAIKFTAAGGEIILSSKIENDKVLVLVSDNGIGLNEKQRQNLFENEVGQKRGTGTAGEKGVGLGLRLVRDFVKMNKGKIEVTSEEGKGSRFEISLPQYQNVEVNV